MYTAFQKSSFKSTITIDIICNIQRSDSDIITVLIDTHTKVTPLDKDDKVMFRI